MSVGAGRWPIGASRASPIRPSHDEAGMLGTRLLAALAAEAARARAKVILVGDPMPDVEPVTRTVLPRKSVDMVSSSFRARPG